MVWRWTLVAGVLCVVAALVAALGSAGVGGAAPLDVVFAFDGTGSMSGAIEQARKDAQAIMEGVGELSPDVAFAVVAFRDPRYPAPEYEILQPLTKDVSVAAKAFGRVRAVTTDDPANVPSEAYNLLFDRSVTDQSLGWRSSSRKVVVVLGDAEPHGAGTEGIRGCRSTESDPNGLNTLDVLQHMRNAGIALLLVREHTERSTTLECYLSLAALGGAGGAATDSGSDRLVAPIVALVEGTFTPLVVRTEPFALPGTTLSVTVTVGNLSGAPAVLHGIRLRLPPGTAALSSSPQGRPTEPGLIEWTQERTIGANRFVTLSARVSAGRRTGIVSFVGSTSATLASGQDTTVTTSTRARIGRTLRVTVTPTDPETSASGSLSLVFPATATTPSRPAVAGGTLGVTTAAARVTVRALGGRIAGLRANAEVVVSAAVVRSTSRTCTVGQHVTLRLVDRDFRKPTAIPDVLTISGERCALRSESEVRVS